MAKSFSYNPTGGGDGFEKAETAEEAQSRARDHLNIARDFASREGWDEDTAGICWGVICEEAVFHENQEYILPDAYEVGNYRLEPTEPKRPNMVIENPENIRTVRKLVRAAVFAFKELNTIRARDGVPYTSNGYQSSVKPEYFSSVVDMLDDAVKEATGKSAHCHPELHSHIDLP